jgi:antitoxin component of RelBE/YafQ-DinJ toxin-antitoxin module
MAKIEIQIEDGILTEAAKVLYSLGMDVEMAVSIYLRRIALEKGLPMNMTGPMPKRIKPEITENFEDTFEDDSIASTRSNSRITMAMVDEVWHAFLRHLGGSGEINPLSTEVSTKTGMNRGSAFIYLTVLSNLVNGDPNTRVLKYNDLEYLMGKILTELGENKYQKALKSLMASVPYWREKIPGAFADKVEAYCKKNLKSNK